MTFHGGTPNFPSLKISVNFPPNMSARPATKKKTARPPARPPAIASRNHRDPPAVAAVPDDEQAGLPGTSSSFTQGTPMSGDKWSIPDLVKVVLSEKNKTAERLVIQKKLNSKQDSDLAAARSTIIDLSQRLLSLESWQSSKEDGEDEQGIFFSVCTYISIL